MPLSLCTLGLDRVLNLFKRSRRNKHHGQRQALFPRLSSSWIRSDPRPYPDIVAGLLQGTSATAAKPLLCICDSTVTTGSDIQPLKSLSATHWEATGAASNKHGLMHIESSLILINTVEVPNVTQPSLPLSDKATQTEFPLQDSSNTDDDLALSATHQATQTDFPPPCGILADADSTSSEPDNDIGSSISVDLGVDIPKGNERASPSGNFELDEAVDQVHHPAAEHGDVEKEMSGENREDGLEDNVSESSDEEEDLVNPDILRADWAPLRAIPEQLFRSILLQHLPADHDISVDNIRCTQEIQGGNNFVRILEVQGGPYADRYVIKVPCVGTASRWLNEDAYMLRNDARTMLYIRKHTDVPCPEVLGFNDTLSNTLGAPYIIMRANKGISSNRIWFDRDEDGDDDLDNAGQPDADRMRIRVNFLRSLAAQMAKLQTLEFDSAGTLNFDQDPEVPIIGPTYHWKVVSEMTKLTIDDMGTSASINCIPPYSSSQDYYVDALDNCWPWDEGYFPDCNNGRRFVMLYMLARPPFNASKKIGDEKESFVLRHDDLNFQNILCDEQGNVTAIIDWDKCRAVPRCVGFTSLPAFLTKDWTPNFKTNIDLHMPWELEEYRKVYAGAMLEATGPHGDGRFTVKSAFYEAVHAALYGGHFGGGVPNVVCKLLKQLKTTRMFQDLDILSRLAEGWSGTTYIVPDLARFIAPPSFTVADDGALVEDQ
jgi:hypothetical protein